MPDRTLLSRSAYNPLLELGTVKVSPKQEFLCIGHGILLQVRQSPLVFLQGPKSGKLLGKTLGTKV